MKDCIIEFFAGVGSIGLVVLIVWMCIMNMTGGL